MPTPTYDMSAPDVDRRPCKRYIEYLNMYTRRLKLGPAGPSADGAGMLCGTRYHGRNTPLKGKGVPPLDGKETPAMVGGIAMPPGRWREETDPLNARRPVTAEDLRFRPALSSYNNFAFKSSMDGSGAVVVDEAPVKRPMRRHGGQAPQEGVDHTRRRVMADGFEADGSLEWWEKSRPITLRNWNMPSKPPTTDSIIRHSMRSPHSEPEPMKLESSRVASPTVCQPCPEASRAAFYDAADAYCMNKGRATYGSSFRLG